MPDRRSPGLEPEREAGRPAPGAPPAQPRPSVVRGHGPGDVPLDPDLARPAPPLTWRDRLAFLGGSSPARAAGVAAAGVVVVAVAAVLLLRRPAPPPELSLPLASSTTATTPTTEPPPTEVVAHAAGAVAHPGVYHLDAGARVADLVAAAGGLTDDADADRVNLAAPVGDGAQVYVPQDGEEVPIVTPPAAAAGAASDGGDTPAGAVPPEPVNLNQATAADLDTLPGVGPATAQAILDWRAANGAFTSVDQLLDVRGIGEAKLADLRPLVTV
jgi:competence protein ComEA